MYVTVKLFASYREAVGKRNLELEVPSDVTLADVWQLLQERYPDLERYSQPPAAAVNMEYVSADAQVGEGDEVAFLPPVSGGF